MSGWPAKMESSTQAVVWLIPRQRRWQGKHVVALAAQGWRSMIVSC